MGHNRMSTDEYLSRVIELHGGNLDFSNSVYVGLSSPLKYRCVKHGNRQVKEASRLLMPGSGCYLCTREGMRKSGVGVINKIRDIQPPWIDLSKAEYITYNTPLDLFCTKHNVHYKQLPRPALSGVIGCMKCRKANRPSHIQTGYTSFRRRLDTRFGIEYITYPDDYKNSDVPVRIVCPIHGTFYMRPGSALKRDILCPQCRPSRSKLTCETYINRARARHGDVYDYSKTKYINYKLPIEVTCRKHGAFTVMPFAHIAKRNPCGCPACGKEHKVARYIAKAKHLHKNKYDYSKLVYMSYRTPVEIICPKHGSFWQALNNHLAGCGCPFCSESVGESAVSATLDYFQIDYIREYRLPEYKAQYRYDFYIPILKLLIEYHGVQHYREVESWKLSLAERQEMDKIKVELAYNAGYLYECIPYTNDKYLSRTINRVLRKAIKTRQLPNLPLRPLLTNFDPFNPPKLASYRINNIKD